MFCTSKLEWWIIDVGAGVTLTKKPSHGLASSISNILSVRFIGRKGFIHDGRCIPSLCPHA